MTSNGAANQPVISPPGVWNVIKRNHQTIPFDRKRIFNAIEKAYISELGSETTKSSSIQELVDRVTSNVHESLISRYPQGGHIHIEEIQDNVIARLIDAEQRAVAECYSKYRQKRKEERDSQSLMQTESEPLVHIVTNDGERVPVDWGRLHLQVEEACDGVLDIDEHLIVENIRRNIREDMPEHELRQAMVDSATDMIKVDPNYDTVAAHCLLIQLREECLKLLDIPIGGRSFLPESHADLDDAYAVVLKHTLEFGVENELIDPRLLSYDLTKLGRALVADRDRQFDFHGLQVIYDRYVLQSDGVRFEMPQAFWMRVAMFLAIDEDDREERAIEFYDALSSFRFISSTPTLFNAGTCHPQLSSCYISTVEDDLESIFGAQIYGNAMLQKWAGGMGNDWTPVRAMGSEIKGTNGKSDGVVPFIKVVDATAKAVNQGGKRAGAVCSYLETWHLDIEEFLDLRKNTGDPMRRTPNMNTANWIPDLFMKRVEQDGQWTLFSPSDVPDLHDLYGSAFEERYERYENDTKTGAIRLFKRVKANDLWKSMLRALAETGHPWITFKDPCNIRSPQRHVGRVHSSNLCTEITLNTSRDEIAVCNLGSINLIKHVDDAGEIDQEALRETVRTGIRMLDNVIDINFYAVDKAANSNQRHRPIGLGMMGFQDVLYRRREPYDSDEAIDFADRSMEWISYYAIQASSDLALERGSYPSYEGSLWQQGILPIDSLKLLEEERGSDFALLDYSQTMPWRELREKLSQQGMRNSNVMAIAPTATIANIVGSVASIEPFFMNTFVKQNMSGEFQVINPYLTADLKAIGLWSADLYDEIMDQDGDISAIESIPQELKDLYKSAFEVGNPALIECAARRQKWIDQSQSLNLYVDPSRGVSPREVKLWYLNAWKLGLKTTYYLHSRSATSVEKTSSSDSRLRRVPVESKKSTVENQQFASPSKPQVAEAVEDIEADYDFCDINDPTCESCAG
ncbi:MAG: ribonucleoside-diphosphate reductase subunit alpha [Gammaproteobacteria bacterium]|nr:ribonucleoside-diphosphate reductase subunit alpha [Gammaproteobacteria bacterium]